MRDAKRVIYAASAVEYGFKSHEMAASRPRNQELWNRRVSLGVGLWMESTLGISNKAERRETFIMFHFLFVGHQYWKREETWYASFAHVTN